MGGFDDPVYESTSHYTFSSSMHNSNSSPQHWHCSRAWQYGNSMSSRVAATRIASSTEALLGMGPALNSATTKPHSSCSRAAAISHHSFLQPAPASFARQLERHMCAKRAWTLAVALVAKARTWQWQLYLAVVAGSGIGMVALGWWGAGGAPCQVLGGGLAMGIAVAA